MSTIYNQDETRNLDVLYNSKIVRIIHKLKSYIVAFKVVCAKDLKAFYSVNL